MSDDRTILDQIIASAAADEPSEAQLERLEARLGPLFLPPGGGGASGDGGAGAAGSAATGGGAIGKWLAGAVAAATLAGGGYVAYRSGTRSEPPPRPVEERVAVTAAPVDAAPPAIDAAPVRSAPPRTAEEALAEEARILGRAQSALGRGDARRALRWIDRHARSFKSGALAEERERLAVEALLRLDRRADAEARAARFHRRYPRSVQGPRIRELLAR
jgi:hypothetical protein